MLGNLISTVPVVPISFYDVRVTIIFPVLLTLAGLNIIEQLWKAPGDNYTILANPSGTATSLPIVPPNSDVVKAGVGFWILLTQSTTVWTKVFALKAPVTVTILLETEQVWGLVAPLSICTKQVTVVRVYSDGKVTVIVSVVVIASVA